MTSTHPLSAPLPQSNTSSSSLPSFSHHPNGHGSSNHQISRIGAVAGDIGSSSFSDHPSSPSHPPPPLHHLNSHHSHHHSHHSHHHPHHHQSPHHSQSQQLTSLDEIHQAVTMATNQAVAQAAHQINSHLGGAIVAQQSAMEGHLHGVQQLLRSVSLLSLSLSFSLHVIVHISLHITLSLSPQVGVWTNGPSAGGSTLISRKDAQGRPWEDQRGPANARQRDGASETRAGGNEEPDDHHAVQSE